MLPALLYSLNAQPRHHTWIFVGFSAEERGLIGARSTVDQLSSEQRARIEGNLDTLGLGPTEVWATHSDKVLLDALGSVAFVSKFPVSAMNIEKVGSTDSESFARYQIRGSHCTR